MPSHARIRGTLRLTGEPVSACLLKVMCEIHVPCRDLPGIRTDDPLFKDRPDPLEAGEEVDTLDIQPDIVYCRVRIDSVYVEGDAVRRI